MWFPRCSPPGPAVLQLLSTPGSSSRCGCAARRARSGGSTRARLSGWSWSPTCPPPGAPPSASSRPRLSEEPACSLNAPGSSSCWWRAAAAGGPSSRCSVSGRTVRTGPSSTSSPARRLMEPGADARWASDTSCWETGALLRTWVRAGCRVSGPSTILIHLSPK